MPSNQLTLLRQWNMLRLVPRAPSKVDVRTLKIQLAEADFEIGMRTIQRDLVDLSSLFPLVCDEREKPYGWSGERCAPSFDLPGLSIPDALTLTLVEQHLRNQLPPARSTRSSPSSSPSRAPFPPLTIQPSPRRGWARCAPLHPCSRSSLL